MKRLRMICRFVRVLVALFVVAQFAGVVSSPLAMAHAAPSAAAAHVVTNTRTAAAAADVLIGMVTGAETAPTIAVRCTLFSRAFFLRRLPSRARISSVSGLPPARLM
jgi:hypothetical protein